MSQILSAASDAVHQRFADHPDLEADSLLMLGNSFNRLLDFSRAESLYRQCLAIQRHHLQPGDPLLARTENNLGKCLSEQMQLDEAERLLRSALEVRRRGNQPADTAESIMNLAQVLMKQGQNKPETMAEALKYAKEGHALCEATLGPADEYTLTSRNVIALILQSLGRLDEAEHEWRATLELCRKHVPETDENRLALCNTLAVHLKKQGKAKEAAELFRECLRGLLKKYPAENPRVLQVQKSLDLLTPTIAIGADHDKDPELTKLREVYEQARIENGPVCPGSAGSGEVRGRR